MILAIQGILTGMVVGSLCGLFGMGGGSVLVPAIAHVFGLPVKEAIGTSLVIIVFTSLASLINYLRSNCVNTKLAFLIIPFGIAGAQSGVFLTSRLPDNLVKYIFILVIASLGIKMLFHPDNSADQGTEKENHNKIKAVVIGTFAGFVSGLCGVGGAVLIIPLFFIFLRIPMHACIGTALIVIFFNALSGGAGYVIRGLVNFKIAGLLAIGSMAAAPLGSRISINTPKERLKRIFAVILILSGLSMLL